MKEDISIHLAREVFIVATIEWDEQFTSKDWVIYLINNRNDIIETVLVVSRGNTSDKKTSTLRRNLGNIPSKDSKKIEFITEEVLGFKNEYLVTFFAEGKMFERTYTFSPFSLSESNFVSLPGLDSKGIIAD